MFQNKNLSGLSSNQLFKGLDENTINSVFNAKNFRAEKEGELIFQAGDESDNLYLIMQGEVKLKYSGTKGNNSFRRLKNEFFGEQEVLERTQRISSAVADTDCIFYLISKADLFLLIKTHREILKNLSFTPVEEEEIFEEGESNQEEHNETGPAEEEIVQSEMEIKQNDEIIMDGDLDYSFDTSDFDELPEVNSENYISYSDSEENSTFNNNGFHPEEEESFNEEAAEEVSSEFFQQEENSNSLPETNENSEADSHEKLSFENFEHFEPDSYIPEEADPFSFNNEENNFEETSQPQNEFEPIPDEPQKFDFLKENNYSVSENFNAENQQQETEVLSVVDGASSFIKNNITFQINEIKKLSTLLSNNSSLPEAQDVKELILKHVDSLQSVVNSTLDFVSNKTNQTFNRQNIRIVLTNILKMLSEYVETRNVKLYKKIETDAVAEVDESNLYNVFLQLARNACDSMPEGGNIFVTATQVNNDIIIEFVDEGIGIPSSVSVEAFEPMFTQGKENASGLGLSIAKKIVEDHNGNISIEGELGEGTKVSISFPIVG